MNKDVLEYLANLALVRQQTVAILNMGRGVVDQKQLHQVSAKTAYLDKLFTQVLLSGTLPGQSQNNKAEDEDDYIDIAARLREAKEELRKAEEQKNAVTATATSNSNSNSNSNSELERKAREYNKLVENSQIYSKVEKKEVEKPSEELDAFNKLLKEAESQVAAVTPVKKTRKRKSVYNA